jgi:hypothetical protein
MTIRIQEANPASVMTMNESANLPVRRIGRRSSLTPQKMKKVAHLIARGNYQKVAAAACGISESAYYEYLQRGESGEEPFATFKTMVEHALIDQETSLVEKVCLAADSEGPDRVRAAQRLLERGAARER